MPNYRETYLCICDGQQEAMYLRHVAKLIKDFPRKVVTFNTYIGSVRRLENDYFEYDSAALFDFDFNEKNFCKNIQICDKLNKQSSSRKKGKRIYHAYSNVNFDLWLILHKKDFSQKVYKNDAYIRDVRKEYDLGPTDDIKNAEIIKKILNKISIEDVKSAISRAEIIRKSKIVTDGRKVGNTTVYSDPDFTIDLFLKEVLRRSGDL